MKVDLRHINFKYRKKEVIFKDFNLSLEKGSFTGLLGSNGSGKSSLLQLILGVLIPEKGTIFFDDFEIQKISERSKLIGYVPQTLSLDGEMTVSDCITFIGSLHGLTSRELLERKKKIKQSLGLASILKRQIKKLSGGQKQLINIALALVHHPEILLLDEPFTGLDYKVKSNLISFLNSLNKTIICATHDIELAETNASTIVLLKKGQVVEQRKPLDLVREYPYFLSEIDFAYDMNMKNIIFSDEISYTIKNRRVFLSYKKESKLNKEVNQFKKKYHSKIVGVKLYQNNLISTLTGLHNFSFSFQEKKKNKKM